MDDYQRFLAEQRYHRDITRPWLFATLAGLGVITILLHAILTLPLTPIASSFVNPYFGGVVVATATAFIGLVEHANNRWLPAIMAASLLPITWGLCWSFAGSGRVGGAEDRIFVILLASMSVDALYVLVRPLPRRPPPSAKA